MENTGFSSFADVVDGGIKGGGMVACQMRRRILPLVVVSALNSSNLGI